MRQRRKIVKIEDCGNPYYNVYMVLKPLDNREGWYCRGKVYRGIKALQGLLRGRHFSPAKPIDSGVVEDLRFYVRDVRRKKAERGLEVRV